MSECEKSTTDLGSIRAWYAGAVDEYRCDTGMPLDEAEAAFDRAIAAHDQALREQIARDIEQHYIGPDCDRNPATGADSPHAAEHRAFNDGLAVAALIAREEDQ